MLKERLQSLKKNFFKISLITLVLLLFLEIIFRIGAYFYYHPYGTHFSNQVMGMWRSDSTLIWDNQPHYLFHDKSGSYNEAACRSAAGDVIMPKKEKGEIWILLSGGSSMLGIGANREGDYFAITQVADHLKETAIDGLLENILNKKGKHKYRVFNCSVSGFTSWQAFSKARKMLALYDFDWVISMDGQNDPCSIPENKNARNVIESYWTEFLNKQHPFQNQMKWMERSALIYCTIRTKYNLSVAMQEEKDSIVTRKKYQKLPIKIQYAPESAVSKGVLSFQESIIAENNWFEQKGIKHLHFIQPHLSLRKAENMRSTEKIVAQYYSTLKKDTMNTYFKNIHEIKWPSEKIIPLNEMHHLPYWVFVDYCHLTKEANLYIAHKIAQKIEFDRVN